MKRYRPTPSAPQLRTAEGEVFPADGKMIDPSARYYARMIEEGDLEICPDETVAPDKPAASAAQPKKETRK